MLLRPLCALCYCAAIPFVPIVPSIGQTAKTSSVETRRLRREEFTKTLTPFGEECAAAAHFGEPILRGKVAVWERDPAKPETALFESRADVSIPWPSRGSPFTAGQLTVVLTIGEQKMDKKGTYTNGEDAYDSSFEICVVDWTAKKLIAKTRHTVTAPQSIKFYDSLYLEDRKRLGRWITTWAQEETSPPPQKPEPVKEQ